MSQNGRVDEIALIQSWLEEAEREYEEAQREYDRLQAVLQDKSSEVIGYRKALEARKRKLATANQGTQINQENQEESNDDIFQQLPSAVDQMLYIIRQKDSTGITPPEIINAFKKEGVPIRANYVYTALGRMLERGRIKKVGHKYFLSDREKARTASDQSLLLEPSH